MIKVWAITAGGCVIPGAQLGALGGAKGAAMCAMRCGGIKVCAIGADHQAPGVVVDQQFHSWKAKCKAEGYGI